jgi:mRNA-degrading endonuclease toxin of MazEF toxin-antitoxin module
MQAGQVILTEQHGMPATCAANFVNIRTVHEANISQPITYLPASKMMGAAEAIGFALASSDARD